LIVGNFPPKLERIANGIGLPGASAKAYNVSDHDSEVLMKVSHFLNKSPDGGSVFARRWLPAGGPKAILLIAHGMAEHSARYEGLAAAMCAAGWAVYAPDHRGHGKTATDDAGERLGCLAQGVGFSRLRDDLREIAQVARAESPGVPLFLFGHSMGSLLAEAYLTAYGKELSGLVLSGVLTPPPPHLRAIATCIAAAGAAFKGRNAPANLLHKMSFESNNRDFEPARSPLDWLSRDTAEVDKYLADPFCGFVCSFGFYRALFAAFASLYGVGSSLSGAPKALPILIVAGAEDPLGGAQGFVSLLADKLKAAGYADIETRLYPGARHEVLNETNRDEVLADIRQWLESRLA
jgi:alpha-beta hydrolase superfamily lysophospholipase